MSAEEWRPIPLAPGYEINRVGQVRSFRPYRGTPTPRLLKATVDHRGYLQLRLPIDGANGRAVRRIHQIVAAVFIGPRPDGDLIRHLDGNRLNNSVENLVYGTTSENVLDSVTHGTHHFARQTHCKYGHEFTPENTYVRASRTAVNGARRCRTCAHIRVIYRHILKAA